MARNGSGTYSLPAGNPVVSGTLIEASWANTTLSDLATAMTDSLSRSGQGGMTAALRLADGTLSVPGAAFSSETSSGFYRAGAGDVRVSITGTQVMQFLSTGVAITGTLSASGAITATGGVVGNVTGNLTGNVTGNVTGNAGTVTNGVYTTGDQTISGLKAFNGAYVQINGVSGSYNGQLYLGGGSRHIRQVSADARWEYVNNTNTAVIFTFANNGDFTATGNVTAYSDERLKKDWADFARDFVQRLAAVKHGTYTRTDTGERQVGVSAQSLRELMPEAVLEDANGTLSVSYGNAALAACVELAKRVIALEAEVAALKAG
jgi:hypothetical protein